jgi:hypothetical protein
MKIKDFLGEILATLEPQGQFHALVRYWEDFCKVYHESPVIAKLLPGSIHPIPYHLPVYMDYPTALMELSRLSYTANRVKNQLELIRTFPMVTGRTGDLEDYDYDETVESMFFEITPDHYKFIHRDDLWCKIIKYGFVRLNDIVDEVEEIFNKITPDEYPRNIKRDMIGDPGNARILLYYMRKLRDSAHYWLECHKYQPIILGRVGRRRK